MTAFDHGLAILLALVCLSQLFVQIDPSRYSRMDFYAAGASTGVLLAIPPLLASYAGHRPLGDFGLEGWWGPPAPLLGAGIAWAALLAAAAVAIARGALRGALLRFYAAYPVYERLMPRSRGELAASWGTSIAVGIGEEIAFRGFLLWYAAAVVGVPAGLLASSLLFGIAHGYQRAWGMAWATCAGLVLGLAYLASGSLLLAIWMHATWDMASFAIGRLVLASTGEAERGPL